MICGCENDVAWRTRTGSPGFGRSTRSAACSVTPKRASCSSCAGEKNGLWCLWASAADLLRPQGSSGPRSLLWRYSCLPGDRGPTCLLPAMWYREARKAALVGRQSLLHETLCLLRGSALPVVDHSRCGAGTPSRLEDGQRAGDGVPARATSQGREAWSQGPWHRRNCHPQGPHLSDRRERPDPPSAHLVWRPGSLGSEHGPLLSVAGGPRNARAFAWPSWICGKRFAPPR
jgi:hypothetical protein